MPVWAHVRLEAHAGIDAESKQKLLHYLDEAFRDHVDLHHRGGLACRHESLGLEDAPQICGRDRQWGGEEALGNLHLSAALVQVPSLHEITEELAVEPRPPAVQAGVLCRHGPLM